MSKKNTLIIMLLLMMVALVMELFYLARWMATSNNDAAEMMQEAELSSDEPEVVEEVEPEPQINPDDWNLLLVNPWNAIPDAYLESLETAVTEGGYEVHASVKEDLENMLADCRAAGGSPVIISGFRTRATQQYLYDTTSNKDDTAYPGTSEHECGLAVDILESGYGGDWYNAEKTAETETEKWLTENCQNYGFILRYPKDKEDITGIVYESWHYRYVGNEHAADIMERGICLEEYLGRIDNEKAKIGSE